jgi:hypothetical protein
VTTYHGAYSEGSAIKHRYNAVMAKGDRVIAVSAFIAELIRRRYATDTERKTPHHSGRGGHRRSSTPPRCWGTAYRQACARNWRLSDMGAPTMMLPGRLTSWKGQKTSDLRLWPVAAA